MDHSSLLLKHTLDSIHSSLSTLQSIGLLDSKASNDIRNLLPSPNALTASQPLSSTNNNQNYPTPTVQSPGGSIISDQQQHQQQPQSASAPSPYPAPRYGATFANGQQMRAGSPSGGGGVNRPPPPLPGRQAPSAPSLPTATALWDYHGSAPDDLRFFKGDIINIDQEVDNDWTRGHLPSDPSRSGLFPAAYVQKNPPIPPRDTQPSPSPSYNDHTRTASTNGYQDEKPHQSYNQPPYSSQPSYSSQIPQPQPYGQMQLYPQQHYQAPPPPQHYGSSSSLQPLPPPGQSQVVVEPPKEKKKFGMGGGLGSIMATSAAGGVGFGAGSAVGSGIINSIF